MTDTQQITLTLNGGIKTLRVNPRTHLADALAEAGSNLPVLGCEHGVCGACTLDVDGATVRGCLMLAVQADGTSVTTVEGLPQTGAAEELRAAFTRHNALQCGYCTPGMLATALEYVEQGGPADRAAIREHLSGNYCRCTGYQSIVDAICDVIEGRAEA